MKYSPTLLLSMLPLAVSAQGTVPRLYLAPDLEIMTRQIMAEGSGMPDGSDESDDARLDVHCEAIESLDAVVCLGEVARADERQAAVRLGSLRETTFAHPAPPRNAGAPRGTRLARTPCVAPHIARVFRSAPRMLR